MSLAFSQGLDYVIQQLAQFANSLTPVTSVETPYASKGRSGGKWHARTGSSDLVARRSSIGHGGVIRDAPPPRELQVYIATPSLSPHSATHRRPRFRVLLDALALSHYYYNPNPNSVVSIARRHSALVDPKVIMAPNANKKKAGTKAKVSTLKVQASPMSTSKTFFILDTIPAVHMAFSPRAWVDLPLYAWEIGMRYLAVFCHRIGVPLTAIWWHDKHSGYVLETECNDAMSKIGFYSIKDMTRDGLNLSTSFASVHVLLSTFTSEANAISASFDKAPAMFCNGSSPTKDVMSSQTVSYADALRDFPEGVYVPSPLPPYFDHPFLPHKCSSAASSSAAGSSAAGSSAAGSSAAGSSAVGVKRTLPLLPRFTKRQRTEGVVAEGGDVVMEDGGDVSIPAVDGDGDVVMQDGASVAATTPSSGAATRSSHNQLHLRDFGSQGEFSPASADVVVGENPNTLHQPLTWADRKGNTEPAPPTLENPYMGVKDYDTWSNQCENEFLKDMDEYKVDPTTKPFPVVKRVEWATLFTNSRRPFQYTEQCPPECKPDIYTRDHASIARHWDKYGALISIRPIIRDSPQSSLDMISSSDGVKLTDAQMVSRSPPKLGIPGFSPFATSIHAGVKAPVTCESHFWVISCRNPDADEACNDSISASDYNGVCIRIWWLCPDDPCTGVIDHHFPLTRRHRKWCAICGALVDDAGIDIKSMQHLMGRKISKRKALIRDSEEKGKRTFTYHKTPRARFSEQAQLPNESDCRESLVSLRPEVLGPGVPPHKALETSFPSMHSFLPVSAQRPPEECASLKGRKSLWLMSSSCLKGASKKEEGKLAISMHAFWRGGGIPTARVQPKECCRNSPEAAFGLDQGIVAPCQAVFRLSNSPASVGSMRVSCMSIVPAFKKRRFVMWNNRTPEVILPAETNTPLPTVAKSERITPSVQSPPGMNPEQALSCCFFSPHHSRTCPHPPPPAFPHASSRSGISPAFSGTHLRPPPLMFPDTSTDPICRCPRTTPTLSPHVRSRNALGHPSVGPPKGKIPIIAQSQDGRSDHHQECQLSDGFSILKSIDGLVRSPSPYTCGPTQPISGWVGTTTSSAVAKGSHVDLTSSFQSIPLGRWFAIVAGPLPNDGFRDIQLWLDVYPQVIAVRQERQKSRFSVQLLFKTRQIRDELKTLVSSWATPRGVDIGTTTVEEPSGLSECFTGWKDLEYVDQGAPPCIKGGAERARYGEFFLHYDTFPPLSGAAPPKAERLRHLDCVEFSTAWFLTRLARLRDHVDLPLRRMEILIRAHKYRSLGAGFAMPMWPTEGPVDAVIHRISRMARDDMGSILTPNPVADESFGFAKSSSVWRIKLDLGLDRPQYPKSE
ncbi:hypothetical protein BS47DRAFT_1368263 [Hydnum rufescens UP504]|uniref:Uncharacterized protein n=1 Tax=Hydnum rufescens UP504 TaxID=1448309 RepID=A0A9P6DNG9_9AGAM|nr:hypothetical protein BS47DRAFT_1368263 [Hydnum rufescens UP504]